MKFQINSLFLLYSGTSLWWKPRTLMVRGHNHESRKIKPIKENSSPENDIKFLRNKVKSGITGRDQSENRGSGIDVGVLSESEVTHHRDLNEGCTAGFVECFDGYTSSGTPCFQECGGDCCVGESIFPNACSGFSGKVCRDSSCNGFDACVDAKISEVVNSCKGDDACGSVGLLGNVGAFRNSCNGNYACELAGADGGTISSLSDSCNADYGCNYLARYSGSVGDLVGSCNAGAACYDLARNGGSVGAVLFQGSCNGPNSCTEMADRPFQVFDVLRNCCNGDSECYRVPNNGNTLPSVCSYIPEPSAMPSSSPSVSFAPSMSHPPSGFSLDRSIQEDVAEIAADVQTVKFGVESIQLGVDLLPGIDANLTSVLEATAQIESGVDLLANTVGDAVSDIQEIKLHLADNTTTPNTEGMNATLAACRSLAIEADVTVLSTNGQRKSVFLLVTSEGAATNSDGAPQLSTYDESSGLEVDVTATINNVAEGKYVVSFSSSGAVYWLRVFVEGRERTVMFSM